MKTRKNIFGFSRVLTVALAAMCLTFNGLLASCDEAATKVETKSEEKPVIPPTPVEKKDTVDYIYVPDKVDDKRVVNNDTTVVNGQRIAAPGMAKLELAEHVVKLFGEDLPSLENAAEVANAASKLNRTTRVSGRDTVFVTTLSTSIANNKNVATTTSETVRPVRYIDGKYIAGAYLVTDAITYTNINIVGRNTRSAEWVLADEFNVAVGVDVVRHEAGLTNRAGRTNLVQHLADTFRVERYIKNDIISWRVKDSVRIATTYVDEYEKYTIEYTKRDNEKFDGDIMLPMNYSIQATELPEAIVSNFNFNLYKNGNVAWESNEAMVKTTETTKVYERHGSYASDFSNGTESFKTLYNTMSQRTVYNDGLVQLSTGYAPMSVTEQMSNTVNVQSDRDGYVKSIFTNNIQGTYLGLAQPVQETKNLYMVKKAEDEITSRGWDSKNKWYKADSVICEADWIEKHSINPDVVSHYRMAIPRSRKSLTNWRATVKQFVQSTADAQKPQTSSNAQSKTSSDGKAVWNWLRIEGTDYAVTTADASTEENGIFFLEANSISVTREGDTLDFGEDALSITHDGGRLGAEATVANGTEVPFTLTWSYKFGNDSRTLTSPGVLFKEKAQDVVTGDWDYTSKKKTITPTAIEVEVKWVEKHTIGSDVVTTYKKSYPRSATVGQAWQAYVAEFTQTTDARSLNKTTSSETANDNGAVWSAVRENYNISATTNLNGIGVLPQNNSLATTEYNNIKLTREGKTVEFGEDAVAVSHDGGRLGSTYKVGNDEATDYILGWNYGFGSSSQNFTSNGKLMKKGTPVVPEEEDKVLSADWANAKEVLTDNGYTLDIDWVVKHSKKSDEVTHYSLPLSRSAKCTTNWSATVSRIHQSTGASTAKKTASSKQSKADGAATWNWVAETYSIVAKTSLTGASAQANEIIANENNSVSITREGKTYSWKAKGISAPHDNGHLKKVTDKQYSYELLIHYNFGTNVIEFACPGTLNLK